jgi:putative ABC transport system permease protein
MLTRIRYAARSLSRAPLLSFVVVLSLGLGIGANTAIFSLLHQVILSSLQVERPNELVLFTAPSDTKGGSNSTSLAGGMEYIFSYPMFRELEKQPAGLTGLAGFRAISGNLAYGSQTVSESVLLVSGGYFPLLGVRPLMGRFITPADDLQNGGNPVAVLGYGYWHDRLGSDQQVLNRSLRINGQVFTIIGIAPQAFTGTAIGSESAAYAPLSFRAALSPGWDGTNRWDAFWLYLIGRLSPGVSMEQAQAAMNSKYAGLVETQANSVSWYDTATKDRIRQSRLTLKEGSHGNSGFRDDARTPVLILITATALVLLIAVANCANLLLARSAERRRELAIRAAMGASRSEILWQFLTEAILLAAAGGLCGVLFGSLTLRILINQVLTGNESPQYFLTSNLEMPVLAFSFAISVVTGLLFGLYPAWEAARSSVATTLKDEGNQSSGTRRVATIRKALVCAQVVVAAVLLVPTGLFLKSMANLIHVDLGVRTQNVIGFSLSPELNGYKAEQSRALFERIESELTELPGVTSVGAAMVPVLSGSRWGSSLEVEGLSKADAQNSPHSWYNEIGPGYFGKMGIPLISGREFTENDNLAGGRVAIVNEEFVRKFYPNRNPVGMHFGFWRKPTDIEVIGVVKDSHYSDVREKPYPTYYLPWRQDKTLGNLGFYVRTALPSASMISSIRGLLTRIDRNLPAEKLRPLEEQVDSTLSNDRLVLRLTSTFAILATLLAMLGLYGVMAHSVTRRTPEIGIRMAVGASPVSIRAMVMREMLRILAIGLVLGVPAALALSKYTESQLYGVTSYDSIVVFGAVLALSLTATAAAYVPARRASRISPVTALRHQ